MQSSFEETFCFEAKGERSSIVTIRDTSENIYAKLKIPAQVLLEEDKIKVQVLRRKPGSNVEFNKFGSFYINLNDKLIKTEHTISKLPNGTESTH